MNKITNPSTPSRLPRSLAFAYAFLLTAAIHMAAQPQDVEQVLTFSSAGDFLLRAPKHWDGTLYYSTNLKDWSVFEGGTIGSSNGRIYLCGKGNTVITGFETLETEEIFWRMNENEASSDPRKWAFYATESVSCSGNIENLLDYEVVASGGHPEMAHGCFSQMFRGCTSLTSAPSLPATTLANDCYRFMFGGCTSLTTAPSLPATTMAKNCYQEMFVGCTSPTTAPSLPAKTMAKNCYQAMFERCTSLTTAPSLTAKTGHIESGNFPVVILTQTVPIDKIEAHNFSELSTYLVKTATVTIVCDDDSVVLAARYDKGYTPPFVYTTSRMRGEAGKSYKLIVQHHGQTFEALTTIPTVVDIDSVIVSKADGAEGKLRLHISFADDPATKDYYKIFSNDDTESKMLLSSTMQTFDDAILSDHNTMPVYRGQTYLNQDYDANFLPGERLTIKLCHIDAHSYAFWHEYENSISFSRNHILQFTENLPSNISGGIGCWCGYGVSTVKVDLAAE